MDDRIQFYYERAASALDDQWRTPRERELEMEFERLSQRVAVLEKRMRMAHLVIHTALGYNDLSYWCPYCRTETKTKFHEPSHTFVCRTCGRALF